MKYELNTVKNKLFSVISHDLKSPMYALRNLFNNATQLDLPAEEIKAMIPDIVNDLNFTTGLMENLLQWAKSQMQSNIIQPQKLDVSEQVNETIKIFHLQLIAKKISVETKTDLPAFALADKNVINLVLRNLLSNAIKYTPENGHIVIGTYESSSCVEVYVQDTGRGISKEQGALFRLHYHWLNKMRAEFLETPPALINNDRLGYQNLSWWFLFCFFFFRNYKMKYTIFVLCFYFFLIYDLFW